jgi:energy-coupling factor transporter ATP-binding protein EcfA2
MLTNVPESNGVGPNFPSRRDNPFATCWTRPGALPFRFADGQDAQTLVARLADQNWWGAIVGPHGSGKSTLLEALKPALSRAGRCVLAIALRDGQRRLPREFFDAFGIRTVERDSLVLIDGYEQLGWLERLRLARRCRRAGAGLLVTAHVPTRLPTLIRLAPNQRLIEQLVADLCVEVSTPISAEDVAASHACHDSNVREIFFDLYDRYERKRRSERTRTAAATY